MSRCPNGSRKHKKTGECVAKSLRKKRCPNGTRKHKKTQTCRKKKTKTASFKSVKSKTKSGSFFSL